MDTPNDLAEKRQQNVLITGAAQGIGECVARSCSAQGAAVFLSDIQTERVSKVAAALDASSCCVDIADPASVAAMVDAAAGALGRIDALINVAGIDAPYEQIPGIDEAHWRRLIDVDLSGPWWCMRAVLPRMVAQGAGRIVNIASVCGVVPCAGVSVAYAAAKAGLIGLTMAMAAELEGSGVLVNAIAPGGTGDTGTPMTDEQKREYVQAHPLGFGGAQPVADAVVHLLGRGGDWVNGAVMNVSGGFWHGR